MASASNIEAPVCVIRNGYKYPAASIVSADIGDVKSSFPWITNRSNDYSEVVLHNSIGQSYRGLRI